MPLQQTALCKPPSALLKGVAFWLWAGVVFTVWQTGAIFLSGQRYGRWRGRMFSAWARGAGRVLGLQSEVYGAPPPGPSLIVANHLSYLDIIALSRCTQCVFVAKSEVASWPVIGWLCRRIGTIFVNRNRNRDLAQTLAAIEKAWAEGVSVVFFPEGTSSAGDAVLPFKPSLLELAARHGRPVHYAALRYRTPPDAPPAREAVCWWGAMTFPNHFFNLLKLRAFTVSLAFGAEPLRAFDRKELARELWAGVSALHATLPL